MVLFRSGFHKAGRCWVLSRVFKLLGRYCISVAYLFILFVLCSMAVTLVVSKLIVFLHYWDSDDVCYFFRTAFQFFSSLTFILLLVSPMRVKWWICRLLGCPGCSSFSHWVECCWSSSGRLLFQSGITSNSRSIIWQHARDQPSGKNGQ